MKYSLIPMGDRAWLLEVARGEVLKVYAELSAGRDSSRGVLDIIPAAETILITMSDDADARAIQCWIQTVAAQAVRTQMITAADAAGDELVIDVVYDGADLAEVAALTGLTVAEVVIAHTSTTWTVAFTGFAPGFGYLVGGDERLRVPRRREPRARVPAGSVALAERFSGIYPRPSPGGWQLLGRTDVELWNLEQDPPALLTPGRRVRFEAVR